ncbi:hypothetical protein FKM82_023566 [Ascaphus truei]
MRTGLPPQKKQGRERGKPLLELRELWERRQLTDKAHVRCRGIMKPPVSSKTVLRSGARSLKALSLKAPVKR